MTDPLEKSNPTQAEYFKDIVGTIREPLLVLDADLRVLAANRSFYKFFKVKSGETIGRLVYDLGDRQWDIPGLRLLLETILPQKAIFNDYHMEHDFPIIGRRILLLNARRVRRIPGKAPWILLAFEDVTERMEMERSLLASEQQFHAVFETASDSMLLVDKISGQVLDSNRAAQAALGFSKRTLQKKNLWELGILKDRRQFRRISIELEKQGVVGLVDTTIPTSQGDDYPADITIMDRSEVIQCNIHEITERKQAEEATRSLARFPAENPNPVLRIAWDGNLLYANQAAFHLLANWELELGKPAPEVLRNPAREVITTQKEKTVNISHGDRIFSISLALGQKSEDVNIYASDVTERVQAEERIRLLASIIKSASDAIIGVTLEGTILSWNPAAEKLFGYPAGDVIGKSVSIIMPPEKAGELAEILKSIGRDERVENYETERLTKAGRRLNVSLTISPIIDEGGRVVGASTIAHDVTERKQAEAALLKMRTLLSETQEISKIGGWEYDNAEGRVVWTDEVYRLHGVSKEYNPGDPAQDMQFYAPEDQIIMNEAFQLAVEAGTPYDLELQLITAAGKKLWVRTMGKAETKDGKVVRVMGNIMDITERKQTESALRDSEERFRATFEQAAVGIAQVDLDGHWLRVNQRLCDIVGYTDEELLPLTFQEITHPDDVNTDLDYVRQVLAGKIQTYSMEKRYIRKDRSPVWVNLTVGLVRDEATAPKYFVSVVEDISDRKLAEEQIRQLNAELEATVEKRTAQLQETLELNQKMIEASTLGIFACRADGPCIIANPAIARISGAPVEKMLQLNFRALESWKKNGLFDKVETALATGEEQRAEIHLTTVFERDAWINYHITTFTSNGELHFLMLVDEITERKLAEQALQERTVQLETANKELEAFSYSVSHDLRSPLRSIDGFSRILIEEYASHLPAEAGRYLDLVRSNTQKMGELVDDLLAFSRLGRQPLRKQIVSPEAIVRESLEDLSTEQAGRQVEIIIGDPSASPGHALPDCQADPALLKQVYVNLLSNALKFTRRRQVAHIEVGFEEQDGEPTYFVRDNGVGFDMQYVGKLFAVFQRLHRSEDYEGTGVGLAIVQRIVNRHGGRAWAEAEIDKGATFYFTLEGGESNDRE